MTIETVTQQDLRKIKDDPQVTAAFTCELPRKLSLVVIVYDLQTRLTNNEVLDNIYEQNFEGIMTREEFNDQFKLNLEPADSASCGESLLYAMRKQLLAQNRVYVCFSSTKLQDYVVVPRCAKCQDFGHIAKHCSQTEAACAHCGESGHQKPNCDRKIKPPACRMRNKVC